MRSEGNWWSVGRFLGYARDFGARLERRATASTSTVRFDFQMPRRLQAPDALSLTVLGTWTAVKCRPRKNQKPR